ncbi:hypothetical protein KQH62_00620 [bacterium]|nr:hypothetical protein [bacterium]
MMGRNIEWNTEAILDVLRRHLSEQRPVTLLNTYQGIPIAYEAEVAMVHPGVAGLIAHPYQTACIKQARVTYIQSREIPSLVQAHPVSIDYTNRVVMVDQLRIPQSITSDLYHSLISPEETVRVELDSDLGGLLEGTLVSLATLEENTIRLVVDAPATAPFDRQDDVHLTFKLPDNGDLVQVGGVVTSVNDHHNEDRKRLTVEGQAAMQDEISVLAYIARQEDAVMNKLDQAYKALRHRKIN